MEERMSFHALRAATDVSEAVGSINRAEAEDDVFCCWRELRLGGEGDWFV
jgi:hypothetical protein